MSTLPTAIALPMLLNSFEEHEVLPPFKILDHYWDCCIVGYAIQQALRQVGRFTFLAATEIIKFGLVLFLAYLFGQGIFQLWGSSNLQTDEMGSNRNQYTASSPEQGETYPFVVEVPSKISQESFKQRKSKDKAKRSSGTPRTSKDEQLEEKADDSRKSSTVASAPAPESPRPSVKTENT